MQGMDLGLNGIQRRALSILERVNLLKLYKLDFLLQASVAAFAVFSLFLIKSDNVTAYFIINSIISLATIVKPEIGLMAVSLSVPFSKKMLFFSYAISTVDIILLSFGIGFLLHLVFFKKELVLKSILTAPILVFLVTCLASFKNSQSFTASSIYTMKFVEMAFVFFASINIIDTEKKLKDFINFNILAVCFMSFAIIARTFPKSTEYAYTLVQFPLKFMQPFFREWEWADNTVCLYLDLLFAFTYSSIMFRGFRRTKLALLAFVIITAGIMMTTSMGGTVSFIAANVFLFIAFCLSKERKRFFKRASILFSIAMLLVISLGSKLPQARYVKGTAKGFAVAFEKNAMYPLADYAVIHGRHHYWIKAKKFFQRYPVFGMGLGNFFYRHSIKDKSKIGKLLTIEGNIKEVSHLHNLYLQLLVEMGILGLLAYLYLLFIFYRTSIMIFKKFPASSSILGAMAGILTISIHNTVEFPFIHYIQIIFGILLGIPFIRFIISLEPSVKKGLTTFKAQDLRIFLIRLAEVATSSICLIVLSPAILIIAILIEIDSEKSAFVKVEAQRPDGRGRVEYRFRTRDEFNNPTKLGEILEKVEFDRIPSLINVIFGDADLF